jgi:hypothetical protein
MMLSTIETRQDQLNQLFEEIFPEEMKRSREEPRQRPARPCSPETPDDILIQKAFQAKHGQEFKALWNGFTSSYGGDDSAADMAFANMLAFWTGGNAAQMERLFSSSGLGQRAKWRDRLDYRERTIQKAISDAREFYKTPEKEQHRNETEAERHRREFAEANPQLTRARCDMIEAETGVHICNAIDDGAISEEDIKALPRVENPRLGIKLEPDNLIMIYMAYGAKTCDAYPEYHYTSALSLLSICTNRNLVLRLSQDDLYPNIWVMNLGKSTVSRKSAAIGKFSRFAGDLFPLAALPQSYSPEGLLEELTEKPKGYLVKDEAAAMIEAMEKNYMLEMRDIYCILYDCKGYRRKLRTSQRNKQSEFGAMDPFINLLCATTPESFSQFTTLNDLTSGWLVRFIYTLPNYKKPYMHFKPISEEDQNAYAQVLSRLAYLKGLLYSRDTPIEIQLEPDAWTYYQAWQEQREGELVEIGDDIQLAFFGRLAFTALKMAILFTIGRLDYTEETNVSLEHVQEACRQVDVYFIPIGRVIADIIAMDEANNLQEKILATLGRNGGRLKWTSLMRLIHQDKDKIEKAVAALVESEEVEDIIIQSAGHKSARWILLNDKNKTNHSELKPIRYAETKSRKGSKRSNVSKSSKVSTDSSDPSGIQANKATIATFAKDATFGKEVEEDDRPSSSPHPRKDAPKEDPGLQRFKSGMKKRHCSMCGRNFSYDLGIHYKEGYICQACQSGQGPAPEETAKPNPQKTLMDR